ncbi:MAG: hypothetical protein JXL80_06640 [Planctomycetes bacterium]|nr:hypothetical protein [Planctomycetota bacterium]
MLTGNRIVHILLLPCLLAAPLAAQDEAPGAATAADGPMQKSVTQYGITWTFAAPAKVGRYATGDWWVVGPVTVEKVAPAPADDRSGSVVNPPAGKKQGYDSRISGYDASLRATFPLELKPGQSLVSTDSLTNVGDKTPDTVRGQYARGPLRTAVVLTCVAEAPPSDAFRPPFAGTEKPQFRVSQLRRDLLPKLAPAGKVPEAGEYERFLERIWLDHLYEWPNRMMHPLENMPDYGREITNITSTVGLMLLVDDPEKKYETLLRRYVQLGIDYWGITQSDNDLWKANGGHNSGRKIPILFAGLMLGHEGMMNVKAAFAEDEQTYYGEGYRGQKVLWKIDTSEERKHEHLKPEQWEGPPFKGDNNGWKSEGYRSLNGPTWVASALTARLLGLKSAWDHDAFFDYVDRWVAEAADGRVDKKTMKPTGYDPIPDKFVKAMWETYRPKADALGAETQRKAAPPAKDAQ